MPYRRCLLLTLLVLGITTLAAGAALAERKVILPGNIQPIERLEGRISVGPAPHAGGFCEIGGKFPVFEAIDDYFYPPNDAFFTLIDPAECGECTETGTITVDAVHVAIDFRTACDQPILVSMVEAKGTTCPEPDLTRVLMNPIEFTLTGPGPGTFQFDLNLGTPICVRGKAFLNITVDRFGAACNTEDLTTPSLAYADTLLCQPCRYYNYYSDGVETTRNQICRTGGDMTPGPFLHYVSGNCCPLVPVLPATWGQLKIRYAPRRRRRRLATSVLRARPSRECASPRT